MQGLYTILLCTMLCDSKSSRTDAFTIILVASSTGMNENS
jgi:hypothetical protein